MPATIDYIFDFGSPNSYCVHKVLPALQERTGAEINYIPVLIGGIFKATNNQPPIFAFANVKGKLAYEQLEFTRFLKKHNLSQFKMNSSFPLNSILVMRAAVAAKQDGYLDKYMDAVFSLVWEKDKKMDDPEVFVAGLTEEGLDGAALAEKAQDQAIKDQLKKNTEDVVARGAFGMPTFFVGDEMFVGKERLLQVEEEVLKAG